MPLHAATVKHAGLPHSFLRSNQPTSSRSIDARNKDKVSRPDVQRLLMRVTETLGPITENLPARSAICT